MNVSVDFCLIPIGGDSSFSGYIAQCQRILAAAGLEHTLHGLGTEVEGDWDAVMAAVRRCHEAVHAMGPARVFTTLKIATRSDRRQTLEDKVDSVRRQLDARP